MFMVHFVYASSIAFLKYHSLSTGYIQNRALLYTSFLDPCYIDHNKYRCELTGLEEGCLL